MKDLPKYVITGLRAVLRDPEQYVCIVIASAKYAKCNRGLARREKVTNLCPYWNKFVRDVLHKKPIRATNPNHMFIHEYVTSTTGIAYSNSFDYVNPLAVELRRQWVIWMLKNYTPKTMK